jgi:hypothetical protein
MKLLKPILFLLLVFVVQSCDLIPLKPGIWKDDKIDAGKRKDFHALNDKVLQSIKSGDQGAIEGMLSGNLLESNYKRAVELVGNHMKDGTYSLYSEYYVVNQLKHKSFIRPNVDSAGIDYTTVAKEMYIAHLLPKEPANKYMITIVYGKFDYGWKVDQLEVGKYSENGKNTPELYKEAKEQQAKGYLVNAKTLMDMARECAQPSDELKPTYDKEMGVFYANLMGELARRYSYPIVISGVPTQPKIFRIDNQSIKEGTYPAICYLTTINIKDTIALKKENEQVKKVIGNIIPGIDKDKDYMLYSIYDKKPNSYANAYSYDVTVKLK